MVSSAELSLHRSYLYAPGSNPRVMGKALRSTADAVILDLEDAVAPQAKDAARTAVAGLLAEVATSPVRPDVHVRVNRDAGGWSMRDVEAVVTPALDAIRLPKVESPAALVALADALDQLEQAKELPHGHVKLYPTMESARGVVGLADLLAATPRVVRVALGASDLLADLGASGDDGMALLHIQSELVLQSRAAGVGPPIDGVHTDLRDDAGLVAAATRARALGFVGKSVIHPDQLAGVHDVFTPTDSEVAQAERVLAALHASEQDGHGTAVVDGAFVDAAIAARARAVLALRSTT